MSLSNAFPQSIADVLTNQTLTASGTSQIFDQFSTTKEVTVVVTISGAVTGTTPTLQFTLWNMDQTGNIFSPASSSVYTSGVTPNTFLFTVKSSRLQLNWTVTGTTPSFGGVYVSFISSTVLTTQAVSATSLPLPTGAATETTLATRLADSTFTGRINTQGQKTMAASTPIVIASDQSTLPVSGTITTNPNTTLDKSGTGTIAANGQTVVATTNGCSTVTFNVTGVYAGAVLAQGTTDGTNWFVINGIRASSTTVSNNLANSIDALIVPCGGYSQVRLSGLFWTSGTAVIAWDSSSGTNQIIGVNRCGTLANGVEIAVAGVAIQLIAANPDRKKLILQNTGAASVRIGTTGITATTGFRLAAGAILIFDMSDCPSNAIVAIREGAVSSIVLAQEIT